MPFAGSIGVIPQVFSHQLISRLAIALAGHFHLEEAGVELEEVLQQFLIGYVGAVDRIDVTARADVDTDILALFRREAFEDSIVKFYEEGQKVASGPRVARIVARRQAPFRKVHDHVYGAGREARADVLLTLVDDVLLKLLARIPCHFAVEWVKEIHHRRRDYRLVERLARYLDRLLDQLACVEIVVKRTAGDLGQLAIMTVSKDRKI